MGPILFGAFVLTSGLLVLVASFPEPASLIAEAWTITPVAVLAAGFANATAVGGGFLFVPLFLFVFKLTAVESLKLSLATQAFGMTSGALGWGRDLIRVRALALATVSSFAGMYVGTYVFPADAHQVKLVFGWASLGIAASLMLEMRFGERQHKTRVNSENLILAAGFLAACFFGGVVNAWISIGIGEVVALYLLFVYKVRIQTAIATGVATLALDSILGLCFHAQLGGIRWDYLIFTAPAVIIGGRYGARIGKYVESREDENGGGSNYSPLKWAFVAVVLLDGIGMLAYVYSGG